MNRTTIIGVILAAAVAGFVGIFVGHMWSRGPGWPGAWGPGMMRGYGPAVRDGDESYGWARGMMGRGGYGPGYGQGYGQGYGPGYGSGYGPGYGPGYGMGPGMMGGGFGPGMMGRGDWDDREDLNLTVDQVTRRFERRLALHGNGRVKLGAVAEKDGAITVEIVTTDKGGLVQRLSIDRKTGAMRPIDG